MSFERRFPNFTTVMQMAQDDNPKARDCFKVDVGKVGDKTVATPSIEKKDLEKERLAKKIVVITYWVEAASRLNMDNLRNMYMREHVMAVELFKALHKEEPKDNPKMNNRTILDMMKVLAERNVMDGNGLILAEERCKSMLKQDVQDVDEEESGSNYDPAKDSEESSDSDEDEGESPGAKRPSSSVEHPAKRPKKGKSLLVENENEEQDKKNEENENEEQDEKNEENENEEQVEAAASAAQSRKPTTKSSKRSHHKKKRCPVQNCKFEGSDLRRHLKVHAKRGDIEEENVEKLFSVVSAGVQQRGSNRLRKGKTTVKGKWKKWCPIPGCDRVVLNVSRHLCNPTMHNMKKGSREVQRLVRMAKRYSGLAELDDNLEKPPPPVVEEFGARDDEDEDKDDEDEEDEYEEDEDEEDKDQNKNENEKNENEENEEDEDDEDEDEDDKDEEDEDKEDEENDDEEQEFISQPSLVEFFSDPRPKTNRHRWLALFFQFLTRPTAGDKKQSIRLQHASQMRNLLEAVDPSGDDILCLLKDGGDIVWKAWVKPNLESQKYKPGTIISYLTSYEKFLIFVTHQRFNKEAPPLHADDIQLFEIIKTDLKGWRSTVDSKSHEHKNRRFVEESEGLLTLEELDKIKSSKAFGQAQRIIIQAGKGKEPSLAEFLLARDFLLTKFSLDTGTRPGPLNNATMREYRKGNVQGGCKVMLVAKHKRGKDGPAICPMLPELHKYMEIYVRQIRPLFAKQNEDALFVNKDGEHFLESTIGRRLTQFIQKCGVELGKRMAFVDMRKLITTEMLNRASPQEQAILRRVLAHSEKTSREWYTRPDLTDIGAQAAQIIQRLLDANDKAMHLSSTSKAKAVVDVGEPSSPGTSKEKALVDVREPTSPDPSKEKALVDVGEPSSPGPSKEKVLVDVAGPSSPGPADDPEVQPSTTSPSSPTVPSNEPPSSPAASIRLPSESSTLVSGRVPASPLTKTLSEFQKRQLHKVFQKELETNKMITMEVARQKMAGNTVLSPLSTIRKRVKQVVNYVNNLVKKSGSAATPPAAEPEAANVSSWLEDFDNPSTRSSRRSEWDDEETKILERAFKDYRKLPSTALIRTILNKDTELNAIKERAIWTRFYNKIKNMFKKKTKK